MPNEALLISNVPFSVSSQIKRAPQWTMVREVTMNAIEAAARSDGEKIVHWTTGKYNGITKAVVWNTGPGMDAADLKAATNLACEINKNLGLDENFGIGAKVSCLGNNKIGMRLRSCKTGRVSEVILGYDPQIDQYVRFERELPNGARDTIIDVTATVQKECLHKTDFDWTEVMLLGNEKNQDTSTQLFSGKQMERGYVATSLYRRFYRLPEGVKLKLDDCYQRLDRTRTLVPMGQRYDKFERTESVRIPELNLTLHFLHDPNIGDRSGLRKSSSGALGSTTTTCCLVHKNEMYSVMTGQEWSAIAPRFGIPFGSKELCIHIELDDDEARPSQYRERLISKETGEDVIPHTYHFAVIERMPEWVKEVIKNASPRRNEDFNDLRKELQDLLNKYKVKVMGRRIDPAGDKAADEAPGEQAVGGHGGGNGGGGQGGGTRRRLHDTPEGATTTSLYEIFEKPPEIVMLVTPEEVSDKGLKGRAAEFVMETGTLFVNGLYEAVDRTIDDVEPEFVGQADPETLRKSVIHAARHALAFRVGKAVVFALAKRANEDWDEAAMNMALTRESLSIAADNYEESLNSTKRQIRELIKKEKIAA